MQKRCTKLQESVAQALDGTTMPLYSVSEQVVLAGQPEPEDWARLQTAGFDLVLNIRSDGARAVEQANAARAAGLDYIYLPLPVYELEEPHLADYYETLQAALRTHQKVLFHCRTASRTALLWMLGRMQFEGLDQASAEAELTAAGYTAEDMSVFQYCAEDYFERVPVSAETL